MPLAAKKLRTRARPKNIRLLVKELGSSALISGGSDEFDETIVIAQASGEPATHFAQRAIQRIAAVERSGHNIGSTLLQAGVRHDAATSAARRSLALALANHARGHGQGAELLLEAGADDARERMISLLDDLLSSARGETLPIRLRFSHGPRPAKQAQSSGFWTSPESRS